MSFAGDNEEEMSIFQQNEELKEQMFRNMEKATNIFLGKQEDDEEINTSNQRQYEEVNEQQNDQNDDDAWNQKPESDPNGHINRTTALLGHVLNHVHTHERKELGNFFRKP